MFLVRVSWSGMWMRRFKNRQGTGLSSSHVTRLALVTTRHVTPPSHAITSVSGETRTGTPINTHWHAQSLPTPSTHVPPTHVPSTHVPSASRKARPTRTNHYRPGGADPALACRAAVHGPRSTVHGPGPSRSSPVAVGRQLEGVPRRSRGRTQRLQTEAVGRPVPRLQPGRP